MKDLLEKYKESLCVFNVSDESDHNFQRTPGTAMDFHTRAAKVMQEHNIKTVLDIGCGFGDICSECNKIGIDAFGIDPIVDEQTLTPDKIYRGTIGSAIGTIFKKDFIVDCIVCTNIIHAGKYDGVKTFLDCAYSHSKFILVSPPNYGTGENLESFCEEYGYENVHKFGPTHSGLVQHYLLKKL